MKISLSKEQQEIVDYLDGNLLVIAGAGSGKTRVLTERIIKLTKELKRGEKILAITFTNKATDELRERLMKSVSEKALTDKIYIGSIHQFCLDIITARGHLIGLPKNLQICESYNDRLQLFKQTLESIPELKIKYMNQDAKENNKKLKELFDGLSSAKKRLKFSDDYTHNPSIERLFKEYDDLLLFQDMIDFDDILRYTYQILTERESVLNIYKRIYKFICIDEAQDLNKAQYEIVKILSNNNSGVTMVGDPNQSIYGFNGSDNNYFENLFVQDFDAKILELNENFRSSKKVIEAANKIETSFEVYGNCKYNGEFEIRECNNEFEEAEYVANKIKSLIDMGHNDVENKIITLNQCIVIARSKYVFKALEQKLIDENIEYTLKVSNKEVFTSESDIISAFELGLRLIVNNKDKLNLIKLCRLLSPNKEYNSFSELRLELDLSDFWKCILPKLNDIWSIIEKNDNDIKFKNILEQLKKFVQDDNINIEDNERLLALDDILEWGKHWENYVRKSQVGERELSNFLRAVSLGSTNQINEKGIVLSTVHMAKGLEYDVVFIIGLNEGVFPDYRAVNLSKQNNNSQLDEEKHSMFVAITRSKRLCYISYPLEKETSWGGIRKQIRSSFIDKLS